MASLSILLVALPPVPKVKEAPRNVDITGLGAGHVDLGESRAAQTAPRQLPLFHCFIEASVSLTDQQKSSRTRVGPEKGIE